MLFTACRNPPLFSHIVINGTLFGKKKVIERKMCYDFFLQILSAAFLTLRRIQRDNIVNVHRSSNKEPAILVRFSSNLNFVYRISKNTQISHFIKILLEGTKFLHADGWIDRRLEPNSHLLKFFERAYKWQKYLPKEGHPKRHTLSYPYSCHSVLGSIFQLMQHPFKIRQFK